MFIAMIRPLAALLALMLAACGSPPTPKAANAHRELSVCVVASADRASEARTQAVQDGASSGGAVTNVFESRAAAEYALNLQRCADSEPDLTVAASATMAAATWQVARQHPSLRFALVDAMPTDDQGKTADLSNVTDVLFKAEETGYLVGVLAGMMETMKVGTAVHNRLGGLGLKGNPTSIRYLAGFVAGARSVDANVGFRVDWTDQTDQAACKAIGTAQVKNQVDILFQAAGACGPGYVEAAYDGRAYAIGSETDQATVSPAVITSALKRLDRAMQLIVEALAAGSFQAGPRYFGLAEDATGVAQPSSVVPQVVLIQLSTARAAILSGSVIPPVELPAGL